MTAMRIAEGLVTPMMFARTIFMPAFYIESTNFSDTQESDRMWAIEAGKMAVDVWLEGYASKMNRKEFQDYKGRVAKAYNMAGWRIGFCVGNAEMIRSLATIKSYYDYGMYVRVVPGDPENLGPNQYAFAMHHSKYNDNSSDL